MNSADQFGGFMPPVRRRKESLMGMLRARELGAYRGKSPAVVSRRLYRAICPNSTIHGIECHFYVKKFTPCGQYLIGISKSLHFVYIYRFKGSGGPSDGRPLSSLKFKDYFELKHQTVVQRETEALSKDFCLVTANGRFIIVAAVAPYTGTAAGTQAYPCSLNCISNLDTVVFYVIELATGKIVDKREFNNEYINVTHHTGVSLYDNLLAVMLVQSQAIQIILVKNDGKLVDLHRIGWFNHEDDELVLARHRDFNVQYMARHSAPDYLNGHNGVNHIGKARTKVNFDTFSSVPSSTSLKLNADSTYHQVPIRSNSALPSALSRNNTSSQTNMIRLPFECDEYDEPNSQMISGIKQRLLAYLYRKAFNADDEGAALRHFHLTFHQFAGLAMWRMQFLDESTLLIKFGKLDCVVGRADNTHQTAFFVFYDIRSTEILAVYDNASEELLRLYESWADQFCATAYSTAGREKRHYSSTCSNNVYTKDHLKRIQYGMRHSRHGGTVQAIKRSLYVLPFSPQSLSDSPYLDQALFSFDEKVISATDRQRPCQDLPIKFYLRGSGELRFKIHLFKPAPCVCPSINYLNNNGTSIAGATPTLTTMSTLINTGSSNTTTATANSNNNSNGSTANTNNNVQHPNTTTATTTTTTTNTTTTTTTNTAATGGNTAISVIGPPRTRRLATFVAHPFEPFIISVVQHQQYHLVLNFHVRASDPDPL